MVAIGAGASGDLEEAGVGAFELEAEGAVGGVVFNIISLKLKREDGSLLAFGGWVFGEAGDAGGVIEVWGVFFDVGYGDAELEAGG